MTLLLKTSNRRFIRAVCVNLRQDFGGFSIPFIQSETGPSTHEYCEHFHTYFGTTSCPPSLFQTPMFCMHILYNEMRFSRKLSVAKHMMFQSAVIFSLSTFKENLSTPCGIYTAHVLHDVRRPHDQDENCCVSLHLFIAIISRATHV